MGYDRNAPKQALDVNADLLRQAGAIAPDLSGMVERLLAEFVERHQARERDDAAALVDWIEAVNRIHAEEGLLSDEFGKF
jgi:hypothetical protein